MYYLLMYLLHGELPWFKHAALMNKKERIGFVETRKMKTHMEIDELWNTDSTPGK